MHTPPTSPADPVWADTLGLMLASTGEGIYGVDLDGLCVFINPAGARMIGYEPAELLGRNDGVRPDPLAFEAPDAYGIMGMRERARHFGGKVHTLDPESGAVKAIPISAEATFAMKNGQ